MASFSELLPNCYYLLQENENSRVELVFVLMTTTKAVLIEFQDEEQTKAWYRKSDLIFEIIEQLSEEHAVLFESIANNEDENEEDDLDWDDMDDDLNTWFGEDDDNDEKIKALNN